MPKMKTNKTAVKRLKKTNPKGNRKAKTLFKQSGQHHMRTKKSTRAKRRKTTHAVLYKGIEKKFKKAANL